MQYVRCLPRLPIGGLREGCGSLVTPTARRSRRSGVRGHRRRTSETNARAGTRTRCREGLKQCRTLRNASTYRLFVGWMSWMRAPLAYCLTSPTQQQAQSDMDPSTPLLNGHKFARGGSCGVVRLINAAGKFLRGRYGRRE